MCVVTGAMFAEAQQCDGGVHEGGRFETGEDAAPEHSELCRELACQHPQYVPRRIRGVVHRPCGGNVEGGVGVASKLRLHGRK